MKPHEMAIDGGLEHLAPLTSVQITSNEVHQLDTTAVEMSPTKTVTFAEGFKSGSNKFIFDETREESTLEVPRSDDGLRNNNHEDFKAVISILNKNISSANASHQAHSNKLNIEGMQTVQRCHFGGLDGAFRTFMRVHNCHPLMDDEDSIVYQPKTMVASVDTAVGFNENDVKEEEEDNDIKPTAGTNNTQKDTDNGDAAKDDLIQSLKCELVASHKTIKDLEKQLQSDIPNPSQITAMVNKKRELEALVVGKKVLETQLVATQEQLIEAKNDVINASTAIKRLQGEREIMKDRIKGLECEQELLHEKLHEKEMAERSREDQIHLHTKETFGLEKEIQQLRLDLNEAHSVLQRVEKERQRERKHYHHLMESATNDKADMNLRIEKEIENNTETRRKNCILEQKLMARKKKEAVFVTQLKEASDSVLARDRRNQELVADIEQLKSLINHGSDHNRELDCLQEMNESLNDKLAASMEKCRRLKDELRHNKKVSSHHRMYIKDTAKMKPDESEELREEVNQLCGLKNDLPVERMPEGAVSWYEGDTSQMRTILGDHRSTSENQTPSKVDDEIAMLLQSRGRFEHLRSEFKRASMKLSGEGMSAPKSTIDGAGFSERVAKLKEKYGG